ncbi:MAG TPA: phage minor capsid protein [Streptosporangiaceae bacterium]
MADAEVIESIARETADLYADVEHRLVSLVAERARAGLAQSRTHASLLDDLAPLRRQAEQAWDTAERALLDRARDAVHRAAGAGSAAAERELRGLAANVVMPTARGIAALAEELVTGLRATRIPVLRDVQDVWRDVAARAAAGSILGAQTRRDATQTAISRWVQRGVTGFVDRSGRRWRLSAYAEMSVRTVTAHAMVQGHMDALTANGKTLVYVSDSPRECPLCRPWEGQVLRLNGTLDTGGRYAHALTGAPLAVHVAGTVADAMAAGLLHPNCTHSLSAYLPGVTQLAPAKSDPEGADAKARQRDIERHLRAWKTRKAAALTDRERRTATRHVDAWNAELRRHLDAHDLKRLRHRERPGGGNTPPRPDRPRDSEPPTRTRSGPRPGDVTPEPVDRLDGIDLHALSDDELAELFGRHGDDPDVMQRLAAEMDRRDTEQQQPSGFGGGPYEPTADDEAIDRLIERGYDWDEAYAQVHGTSVEDMRNQERAAAVDVDRMEGETRRQATRRQYDDWVYTQYLAAEQDTRGHLITQAAQTAGIDPISLFSGPASRARKWASEELRRWWQDHQRLTFDEWQHGRDQGRGAGREFGL